MMQVPQIDGHDDVRRLRRAMTQWSMSLRVPSEDERPDVPRFVSYDTIRLPTGETVGRKKVILMSGGCSVPTCTMCPFTNENNYGRGRVGHDLLGQVREALSRTDDEPGYELMSLYNDGSFFAPQEIPEDIQLEIARAVSAAGVRRLVVESLPQFVTRKRLQPFVEQLGDVALEIGIGFQSANQVVREVLINTRVSQRAFEDALKVMSELQVTPKIYLMIKPPFVTDEEALTDVLDSVTYLKGRGIDGVTLCPTRVSRNTIAWELHQTGDYVPPNLWTVLEAVRIANRDTSVRVACINLRGSDFESIFPDSCPQCADRIVDALVAFSETGDAALLELDCGCREAVEPAPLDVPRLLTRAFDAVTTHADGRVLG
jgi:radical SAM enzyme (TIGR01210 family)